MKQQLASGLSQQYGAPLASPMMQAEQVGYTPDRGGMGGVGGMFQNMQQQFGQQMTQMQSSPLRVYSDYLNQTYTGPQSQEMQSKVTEFVDLVDQAERAHFGVEESFGYGRPPASPMMQNMGPGSHVRSAERAARGIASLPPAFAAGEMQYR